MIQKLLEIEKTTVLPNEGIKGDTEEDELQKDESLYTVESFQDDTGSCSEDSVGSKDDLEATDVPESATNAETTSLNTKSMGSNPVDACVINLTEYSVELGNIGFENMANAADDETMTSEKTNLQAALVYVDLVEEGTGTQLDAAEPLIEKPKEIDPLLNQDELDNTSEIEEHTKIEQVEES